MGPQHIGVMKASKAEGRQVYLVSQVVSCHTLPGLGFYTYISFPLGHIFKCPAQKLLAYWTVHSRRVSSSQGVQGFVTALFTRTRGCILLSPVSPIDHCAWLAMNVQWTFTQRTGQVTASLIITGDVYFSVSITNSIMPQTSHSRKSRSDIRGHKINKNSWDPLILFLRIET